MKKTWTGVALAVIWTLTSGCGMQNVEVSQPSQTPWVVTQLVTVVVVVTATPAPASQTPVPQLPTDVEPGEDWVLPTEAIAHVGEEIQVKLESAQCSFQAGVSGTPTFCNDQPYPNHNFTFLVWGEDWSFLDQSCVVVQGIVDLYQEKPQIQVSDSVQVWACGD